MRTGISVVTALALVALVAAWGCGRSSQTSGEGARYTVTVDGEGFHPDKISAEAGKPVTLALTRTTDATCAKEIVIADLNERKDLPLNQTVELTVTPAKSGDIKFACGMDMLTGVIEVR